MNLGGSLQRGSAASLQAPLDGDAYDNAMCESFATLECELLDRHRVKKPPIISGTQAMREIDRNLL